MRKFLVKTFATLLAAGGIFTWFGADASVLAGASSLGMDDTSSWLAANSQDPKPFDLLEAVNAGMLQVEMPWNEVNSVAGAFAWAYKSDKGYKDFAQLFSRLEKRSVKPVVILTGGSAFLNSLYPQQPVMREELLSAWDNYVRAAVQQFGDQVDYWQIGEGINDPSAWGSVIFPSSNSPTAPPDPALYADMLKISYNIIKSADATDTVILGGLVLGGDCAFQPVAYLQSIDDLDAWFAFDIVSIGLPTLSNAPESAEVGNCDPKPIQSSGMPVADEIRVINDFIQKAGRKPIWVHNLSISPDLLSAKAAKRGTLPEVVESDYLVRATAILMANGGADKVFWRFAPLSGAPGAIALQSYTNLSRSLGGIRESTDITTPDNEFDTAGFHGSGKLSILTWRKDGGDEAKAQVIPDLEGYNLRAWSADASSLKDKNGVALRVDSGGSTALLVSERPVLISAKPAQLKDSISLYISDSAAQAGKGLQAKLSSFLQAQKAKAADKVGAWVDQQQQSLVQTLKESFNQWLRKSLGLGKM